MSDDLILDVAGRQLSGWTAIRVTRGIERMPSDFDIEMTDLYPDYVTNVVVQPGDACVVKLGADVVITGYVDRFTPMIDKGSHTIRVSGRSKCADLVDCAAEWPGGQINASDVFELAKRLVAPYGQPNFPITVTALGARLRPIELTTQLILGETPFEIIERMCRWSALLAYDDPNGNLVLSQVGTVAHASGFTQAQNVQAASITYSMDQRYSEYLAFVQSTLIYNDVGGAGDLITTMTDRYVPRHRRKIIIAESGDVNFDVTRQRAVWEANRRAGRSFQVTLTADSWRDAAGTLWTPNMLVPIDLPALKLPPKLWVISEVTYKRDQNGTTADLVIMPPGAFDVQPFVYLPTFGEIVPQAMK
jgi:prophage tail gpP-like protein